MQLISTLYKSKNKEQYDSKISRFYLQVLTQDGFKRSSYIELNLNDYVYCTTYKDIASNFSKGKVDAKMKFAIRSKLLGKLEINKKGYELHKEEKEDKGGNSDNEQVKSNLLTN